MHRLLCDLLFVTVFTQAKETTFRTCKDRDFVSNYVTSMLVIRSRIDCARQCSTLYNCVSFSVRGNICKMSDLGIDDTCSSPHTENNTGTVIFLHKEKCINGGFLVNGSCWCVDGFAGDNCQRIVKDCSEASLYPYYQNTDAILRLLPESATSSFPVQCQCNIGSGKTIIMSRSRNDTNFNRDWYSYKNGFGDFSKNWASDIWIGLKNMHAMTKSRQYTLKVLVGGVTFSEINYLQYYYNFSVSSEDSNYSMEYTSTAPRSWNGLGDSFSLNKGMPFSTFDRDSSLQNCPILFGSGWWFSTSASGNCSYCNPTGILGKSPTYQRLGINQEAFFEYDLGDWAPHRVQLAVVYSP